MIRRFGNPILFLYFSGYRAFAMAALIPVVVHTFPEHSVTLNNPPGDDWFYGRRPQVDYNICERHSLIQNLINFTRIPSVELCLDGILKHLVWRRARNYFPYI